MQKQMNPILRRAIGIRSRLVSFMTLGSAAGLLLAFGCTSFEGTGGGSGSSTVGSVVDTASSSTGIAPGCEPVQGQPVPAECGVFVKVGGHGDGSQQSPLGSITTAVSKAEGKPIYVCASPSPFIEKVEIDRDATLFGGLDCATWVFNATHTRLKAQPDITTMTVRGLSITVSMSDFDITGVDASTRSTSSIAFLVDRATVHLTRVALYAGTGAIGAIATPRGSLGAAPGGGNGTTGCSSTTVNSGGGGGQNACGITVSGGNGGKGGSGPVNGSSGTQGSGPSPGGSGKGEDGNGSCQAGP